MAAGLIPGPRRAGLLVAVLFVIGVVGAGPAGGASSSELVRVMVQLDEPPLAQYRDTLPNVKGVLNARTAAGHLDVRAPASRAYLAHLAGRQAELEQRLASRGAAVHWRYGVAFNGLAVEVPRAQLDALRRLPRVVAVTETYELEPELEESRGLIGLAQLWQSLPPNSSGAGAGSRVALIDSGVNPLHPFFNPAGYTAPAGYPKAQRVAGGVRTDLPLATYASNKVIVGNVYSRPGNTTSTPWAGGSLHGTHVAGIMAGVDGTYEYTSGPSSFSLQFSGMAPGAYVMNYRLDGDSAEFVAAIEDVVADQADALNISLGHSRWLTTDVIHDPVRQALDAAVDAGTIVAASAGNAGTAGDSTITGSWKLSPKVIATASSSHARVFSNAVTVTGPGTPPASLSSRVGVPAAAPAPAITETVSGIYEVAPGGTGGNAGEACDALPEGSLTGKIALVARGTCAFNDKKNVVVAAGAIGMIVHNNGADAPIAMGAFAAPFIPSVMVTLADGRAMVAWAAANTDPTVDIEAPIQRLTSGWPDVVSSFSSRGPSPTMAIKPDIAAPGASILSSIVNDANGTVAPPHFEQVSGTSMASPHIAGLAALVKARHPSWTPSQVKSALLNTAETSMSLDVAGEIPALAKHRGAGRVNAARLANPQLTFEPASISFGLVPSGDTGRVTITAADMRDGGPPTGFGVGVRAVVGDPAVTLTPTLTFTSGPGDSATITVDLATSGAPAGDYEGFLEVSGGGQTYTVPYFVRVQDAGAVKDVLLIDWDRNLGGIDYRPVYEAALTGLGLSYDVFDGGTLAVANANPGPTFAQLQNYRTVVLFTGNNPVTWSLTHVGGSFPLQDYLVAGGRLIMTGQDVNSQIAYNQNVGSDFNFTSMAGWMTGATRTATCAVTASDRDFYGANPGAAELETTFTLFGRSGDVSVNMGGNGADNQRWPDAGRPVTGDDAPDPCVSLYNAASIGEHVRVLGSYVTTKLNGADRSRVTNGVATGVVPDQTLGQLVPRVNWSAALLHVGAEGLNPNRAQLDAQTTLGLLHDFVSDDVSVAVTHRVRASRVDFVAHVTSKRPITRYRWDFGDGSPIQETTVPRITYDYGRGSRGAYTAYVEAVSELTRTGVGTANVRIIRR